MTDLTEQIPMRFLTEHDELLSACTAVDVALLLHKGTPSAANTLIATRVTAGCPLAPQSGDDRAIRRSYEQLRDRLSTLGLHQMPRSALEYRLLQYRLLERVSAFLQSLLAGVAPVAVG